MESGEKCLDSQLWHACAGGMVQTLRVNSKVFYFPQGHAEHTLTTVDFSPLPNIPPLILCRVCAVKYLADQETDEVYARITLVPIANNAGYDEDEDDELSRNNGIEAAEKSTSFAKTLTQSDANNGGGFSVPRYCAETIFPPLDYAADPPVQTLTIKDVHGVTWKFRHIYRGTPRRHLLTTGWSNFVNHKKLVAGDSIVFLRSTSGEIFVGIRRVKKASISCLDTSSSWSSLAGKYAALSSFLKEDENKTKRNGDGNPSGSSGGGFRDRGRVNPQSVLEAAYLAACGNPFEVAYHPRASTPEFCVKASSVSSAMKIQWTPQMRFKMAFETEDSSRISWFLGTISSVRVIDPIQWPNSPWRLLQVTWDEPDLLQNVKHVSPWMVELVATMPMVPLSHFSPPRKKLCLPQNISLESQVQLPSFSRNTLEASSTFCCSSDNLSAGIQEARHMQFGHPLMDIHLSNKLNLGLSLPTTDPNHTRITRDLQDNSENVRCSVTPWTSSPQNVMTPQFLLFGQPILTEQQLSHRSPKSPNENNPASRDRFPNDSTRNSDNNKGLQEKVLGAGATHFGNQTVRAEECRNDSGGHCKVFLGAETVAKYIDLSPLESYEEVYKKLADIFGISSSVMRNRVIYCDSMGAVKQIGGDLFSEFKKKAQRLTVLVNPSSSSERRQRDGLPSTTQSGLDSSSQPGFLGISA
ncbi:unnamed protein product [Cuscuta epithymum]|uniref:Auxin response factor n=1 Tax=Cuscuta epithymum TaxID=186058 RepID=A0AAV0ENQ3_9ASTE|nr:unnamed protein product [Cuscuta epithymum]CAH9124294.1 unnamed protein product [Cuscuta epithymum]